MTPEAISTPDARTPVADNLGNHTWPWFLYFTALTRRLGALADAVLGWSNLTTAGAIPKVSATDGTLEESPLVDNGTTEVDLVGRGFGIDNNQYHAQKDSAGTMRKILYLDNANPDVLHVRNNQRNAGGAIDFEDGAGGSRGAGLDGSHNFDVVGDLDVGGAANVSGVYMVAGVQVVGAQQADPGVVATSPSVSTSNTAQTADATYSLNEQTMLNDLKLGLGLANTSLANLQIQVDNLIADRDNLRAVLQTHGLMA